MQVIISGGGTGGHVFPAIAIAQELKSRVQAIDILFVGAKGKMEMEKVPQAGFTIKGLDVIGFNRTSMLKNLSLPIKLLKSFYQAYQLLKAHRPQVVVGVGGYASGPTLYMAHWLNIPTLIQEQNSYAGKTNKLLGKKAKKICVAYEGMDRFFAKDKIVFTGNPVRKDLMNLSTKRAEAAQHFALDLKKKTVLVMGGSLGARTINECMANHKTLIDQHPDIQWIWQYGKQGQSKYNQQDYIHGQNVRAMAFIERTDLAYAIADVILCRAGALTISEILITEKPVILVPSPTVAEDHQTHNAAALCDRGAAWLIKDVGAIQLAMPMVIKLVNDEEVQQSMKEAQRKLAKPQAAAAIVDEILNLIPISA